MGLDDVLALNNFSESLEGGASGTSHILAHVPHGPFLQAPLLLSMLNDGGIVVNKLLVMDLLEALSSKVQCKSSAKGRWVGHGEKVNDILKPWGGARRPGQGARKG